ncbi:zinc finger CCCH domain-containing protein 53 [Citrus sinensis]|uniref:Zinc finger CCCH domain-containing protein 53 n=1 Tax=Citrus sinensis TaxID=2711 RepID=A0ACB8LLY3_CITSI|nr:zinc finger CCCH domain-containing protein 53 [Citrus sinensis]
MDGYEATRIVFSRIQNLDPENASKIMGLLLLQDHGEKEMIRLAFGPEALVHSVILKARKELVRASNSPNSPSTPSSPSPFLARQNSSSSRLLGSNNLPPLTIPSGTSWSTAVTDLPNPDDLIPQTTTTMNSSALPFYGNGTGSGSSDVIDEYQLQDQLSFLNESSQNLGNKNQDLFYPSQMDLSSSPPNGATDSMLFPSYWGGGSSVHRRSCSVSDVLGSSSDDLNSGLGWRPCLYFARGYCKNGSSCRFVHGGETGSGNLMGSDGAATLVGSPSKMEPIDHCHELLRSKSAAAAQVQQQRLAAASQLMGSSSFPYSPKSMNLFLQQQQNDTQRAAAAAALMLNEDMHKFGRSRLERNDFSINGSAGIVNPASRQIYLTFPADSTFREEDVSNYFRKQQQQVERGEFSPCGTPTGLDSRDPFDLQHGARMFYNNTQDMLWRRKMEEQADLQQALELQSRRLMGLQLLDVKKHHHHRALSTGSPIPSPTHSPNIFHQNLVFPPLHSSSAEPSPENGSNPLPTFSAPAAEKHVANGKEFTSCEENINRKDTSLDENNAVPENLEHNLPDSPFASPTKGTGEYFSAFSNNANGTEKDAATSAANNNLVSSNLTTANASLDMASFKSFNCQMPRFSSGHGAIGMYTGTGGPTCPVGN